MARTLILVTDNTEFNTGDIARAPYTSATDGMERLPQVETHLASADEA